MQDRIDAIGSGGDFRDPLMQAISHYYWLRGTSGNAAEIKALIRAHEPLRIARPQYLGSHLDNLVGWYARRATHEPHQQYQDELLRARLIKLRESNPRLPDTTGR